VSSAVPEKVVYDCNVYLQFLLSATGPAARCIHIALRDGVELQLSEAVLTEIQDLPSKKIAQKYHITDFVVRRLSEALLGHATFVDPVPSIFEHPIDPDDSAYVNLALAGDAKIIVSRDRHLLGLTDPAKAWGDDFRHRFPHLRVVTVVQFLEDFDRRAG